MRNDYDGKVIVLDDNPALDDMMLTLRSQETKPREFRRLLRVLGHYMGIEISKYLPTIERTVTTHMDYKTTADVPAEVYFIGIARAGIPFMEGMLDICEEPHGGVIGSRRSEGPVEEIVTTTTYFGFPEDLENLPVIVADPMLATGGTFIDAMKVIYDRNARMVWPAAVVATPEGIERILQEYPNIKIFTFAIDGGLNEVGYIIEPGLGDAGKETYGTKH